MQNNWVKLCIIFIFILKKRKKIFNDSGRSYSAYLRKKLGYSTTSFIKNSL